MSIEIKHMSIKSNVVQRQAGDGAGGEEAQSDCGAAPAAEQWRLECRRLVAELLAARAER